METKKMILAAIERYKTASDADKRVLELVYGKEMFVPEIVVSIPQVLPASDEQPDNLEQSFVALLNKVLADVNKISV